MTRLGKPAALQNRATQDDAATYGSWRDGRFDFHSPSAREAWHHDAYRQGVDPENWQLGGEMDAQAANVIAAGLGGSHAPTYRGADGGLRFANSRTIERPEIRAIRQRAFAGETMDTLTRAYQGSGPLPGAEDAVAHLLGPSSLRRTAASLPANTNTKLGNVADRGDDMDRPRASIADLENETTREQDARPDLLLAQADTGTQSDANTPPASPSPASPSLAGTTPPVTFPSGSTEPSYPGEKKAQGKRAKEAEALIPGVIPATIWPVDGDHRLNEPKGAQGSGYYGTTRGGGTKVHNGYDITAPVDAPVRAIKSGKVVRVVNKVPAGARGEGAAENYGYGNEVIIQHDDGTFTQYAHLNPALDAAGTAQLDANGNPRAVLEKDMVVEAGQIIGSVGQTGNVPDKADSHLHFEVRVLDIGVSAQQRTTIHPGYALPKSYWHRQSFREGIR